MLGMKSLVPLATAVASRAALRSRRIRIWSGLPTGWAAADHSRNRGLRTMSNFPPRVIAADQVRAGGRQRCPGLPARGRCGQHVGVGEGQLGQEVRIGLGEVEGHGAGAVVGGDTAGQVTRSRGLLRHAVGAVDGLVVGHARAAEPEQALERAGDVAGPDERAGRVADSWAQAETCTMRPLPVGAGSASARSGTSRAPSWPGHVVQRDEPVVCQAETAAVAPRVGRGARRRVDRVDLRGRGRSLVSVPPRWLAPAASTAAQMSPPTAASALRWPPTPNLVTTHRAGEPAGATCRPARSAIQTSPPDCGQRRGLAAEGDGRRNGIAPRIDPGHRRVERIEHPEPGRSSPRRQRARHRRGSCSSPCRFGHRSARRVPELIGRHPYRAVRGRQAARVPARGDHASWCGRCRDRSAAPSRRPGSRPTTCLVLSSMSLGSLSRVIVCATVSVCGSIRDTVRSSGSSTQTWPPDGHDAAGPGADRDRRERLARRVGSTRATRPASASATHTEPDPAATSAGGACSGTIARTAPSPGEISARRFAFSGSCRRAVTCPAARS